MYETDIKQWMVSVLVSDTESLENIRGVFTITSNQDDKRSNE